MGDIIFVSNICHRKQAKSEIPNVYWPILTLRLGQARPGYITLQLSEYNECQPIFSVISHNLKMRQGRCLPMSVGQTTPN